MTDYAKDQVWKEKLSQAVLDFYIEHEALLRFYIQDRIPNKLLNYSEPELLNKYGTVTLYVNTGSNASVKLSNRDYVLFTVSGILASSATAKNFWSWDKLAKHYADNKPANANATFCRDLTDKIAKKIAPSLVGKCSDLSETMVALISRALRMLVGLERLPPDQLPYLHLPSEGKSENKATPSPVDQASKPASAADKYAVDF